MNEGGGWRREQVSHLDSVRLFGVFVMSHTEAQRVFCTLYQHESGALKEKDGLMSVICCTGTSRRS